MKRFGKISLILFIILFFFSANSFIIIKSIPFVSIGAVLAFIFVNVSTGFIELKIKNIRLKICNHGAECLLIFSVSVVVSVIYHIVMAFYLLPEQYIT